MNPLFWQYLAAAELSPGKAREFLSTLGPSHDPISALMTYPGLSKGVRNRFAHLDLRKFERALASGVQVLTEDAYPDSLSGLPGMPPSLFVWGDPMVLHEPCVGIVGTRRASAYGKAAARKFAEAFALAGVTVVSGGALGIDAQAHEGALEAGGKTVAVLGNGVEAAFPQAHAPLFARIREQGCLVSQFAVGKPSVPENFPIRNQLVAALCDAVLVVEAPLKSGSLITTTAAAEMGREVFVIPSTINHENFRGSHALIRDGATLVDHPDQIFEALGIEPARQNRTQTSTDASAGPQGLILGSLGPEPLRAEQLIEATGLNPEIVMSELTMLELDGLVLRGDGGYSLRP